MCAFVGSEISAAIALADNPSATAAAATARMDIRDPRPIMSSPLAGSQRGRSFYMVHRSGRNLPFRKKKRKSNRIRKLPARFGCGGESHAARPRHFSLRLMIRNPAVPKWHARRLNGRRLSDFCNVHHLQNSIDCGRSHHPLVAFQHWFSRSIAGLARPLRPSQSTVYKYLRCCRSL